MKLKGKTTIELTNPATGEVERMEEENMLTNALADLCDFFPQLYDYQTFNSQFGLMNNNVLGGIKLFDQPLQEDANDYYLPNIEAVKVIGYASNDTTDGTDSRRGSRNIIESKEVENGFQIVWDFATSEANGSIQSICLTTAEGGKQVWFPYRDKLVSFINKTDINQYLAEVNLAEGYYVTIQYASLAITIKKYRFYYNEVDLTHDLFTPYLEFEQTLSVTLPVSNMQFNFRDGGDEYWYAAWTAGNGSGNAIVHIAKIHKVTLAYTCDSYSFIGVKAVSSNRYNHMVYQGYLYLNKVTDASSNYGKGFYKINLSNVADVVVIDFPEWSSLHYNYHHICPVYHGMMFANGILFSNTTYEVFFKDYAKNDAYYYGTSSNLNYYCNQYYFVSKGRALISNYYSNSYLNSYLNMDKYVLLSINNLSTPVVKTPDKTMKITYTLTYEENTEDAV